MLIVDVIIVNWNSGAYLLKCVQSILTPRNEPHVGHIFVIDNKSSDKSLSSLPEHYKIKIIENSENLGFSKACNQGFRLNTSPYVLLLNPDTLLFETTIAACITFMEKRSDVGILGCRLIDEHGNTSVTCARFPTPARYLSDAIGFSKVAPRLFKPALLMTDWDHRDGRVVDQVMGAFMFMRRAIFEKFGFFDERFFVYYEELDFSKRLADAGGKSYYEPSITAIHHGQGTTHSIKGKRLFFNLNSRLGYSKKHFDRSGYFLVYISTCIIEPVTRIFLSIVRLQFKEVPEIIQGYRLLFSSRISRKN